MAIVTLALKHPINNPTNTHLTDPITSTYPINLPYQPTPSTNPSTGVSRAYQAARKIIEDDGNGNGGNSNGNGGGDNFSGYHGGGDVTSGPLGYQGYQGSGPGSGSGSGSGHGGLTQLPTIYPRDAYGNPTYGGSDYIPPAQQLLSSAKHTPRETPTSGREYLSYSGRSTHSARSDHADRSDHHTPNRRVSINGESALAMLQLPSQVNEASQNRSNKE